MIRVPRVFGVSATVSYLNPSLHMSEKHSLHVVWPSLVNVGQSSGIPQRRWINFFPSAGKNRGMLYFQETNSNINWLTVLGSDGQASQAALVHLRMSHGTIPDKHHVVEVVVDAAVIVVRVTGVAEIF